MSAAKAATCKYHPTGEVIEDPRAGDLICGECGVVIGERVVDVRSEWRTFSNDDKKKSSHDPSRVGMAEDTLLGGGDLSTMVSVIPGLDLTWARWQSKNSAASDTRSLRNVFDEISKISSKMNLKQSVVDQAKQVYKQAYEKGAVRGRKLSACAAACVYIACRNGGFPRSFKEVCTVTNHSAKDIGRCYKAIIRALDKGMAGINSTDYISRFGANLGFSRDMQVAARHIARVAGDMGIVAGKSPITVAATALYLVSQVSRSPKLPKEVAEVSGLAESTLKLCYRELYPVRHFLFPSDFKFASSLMDVPFFGGPVNGSDEAALDAARKLGLQRVRGEPVAETSSASAASAKSPRLQNLVSST